MIHSHLHLLMSILPKLHKFDSGIINVSFSHLVFSFDYGRFYIETYFYPLPFFLSDPIPQVDGSANLSSSFVC